MQSATDQTKITAYACAKDFISPYVDYPDTYEWLRTGHMGHIGPDYKAEVLLSGHVAITRITSQDCLYKFPLKNILTDLRQPAAKKEHSMTKTPASQKQARSSKKQQELTEQQREALKQFVQKINTLTPSEHQEAIFQAARSGHGRYVINAGPGSGKTTTAIKLATYFSAGSSIYFSFNKKIQMDTAGKLEALGSPMIATTLHAFGKGIIEDFIGHKSQVNNKKYNEHIKKFIEDNASLYLSTLPEKKLKEVQTSAEIWAAELLHYLQVTLSEPTFPDLLSLVEQFDLVSINPSSPAWPLACLTVAYALQKGKEDFQEENLINFDDMIYYPATMPMPVPVYNHMVIDEAQDLNKAQLALVKKACHDKTQVFAVGDEKQSIYQFAGADLDSIKNIIKAFNAEVLPLRVCYRCGTNIIDLANQLDGQIIPAPGAHAGLVNVIDPESYLSMLHPRDAVIGRVTVELVEDCLKVLQAGKRAVVLGKKIGESIAAIVTRLEDKRISRSKKALRDDLSNFQDLLTQYHEEQRESLKSRRKDVELALAELSDKVDTVAAFYSAYITKCIDRQTISPTDPPAQFDRTSGDFKEYIRGLFDDNDQAPVIQFMTAHRSKGLEFERVFIIGTNLFPHPKAKSNKQQTQEQNLMYVAITRAMSELYFIKEPFKCLRIPGYEESTPANTIITAPGADYVYISPDLFPHEEIVPTSPTQQEEQQPASSPNEITTPASLDTPQPAQPQRLHNHIEVHYQGGERAIFCTADPTPRSYRQDEISAGFIGLPIQPHECRICNPLPEGLPVAAQSQEITAPASTPTNENQWPPFQAEQAGTHGTETQTRGRKRKGKELRDYIQLSVDRSTKATLKAMGANASELFEQLLEQHQPFIEARQKWLRENLPEE